MKIQLIPSAHSIVTSIEKQEEVVMLKNDVLMKFHLRRLKGDSDSETAVVTVTDVLTQWDIPFMELVLAHSVGELGASRSRS